MAEWYYSKGNKAEGPVSFDALKELADTRLLRPDDLVWTEGMADWSVGRGVQGLFSPEALAAAKTRETAPPSASTPPRRRRLADYDLDRDERRYPGRWEEHDDPELTRQLRKGSSGGAGVWILASVLIALIVAGVAGVFAFSLQRQPQPMFMPVMGPAAPIGVATPIPLTDGAHVIHSELNDLDPGDRDRLGTNHKVYRYKMTKDRNYLFQMRSQEVDSYIRIETEDGVVLAENDDEVLGRIQNSRLHFQAPETATYRVVITTCDPGQRGRFELRITPQ